MTDTYLTLNQLNAIFQNLIISILGLDLTDWQSYLTAQLKIAVNITAGTSYQVGDVLTLVQSNAQGGTFMVDTVDTNGKVLTGHTSAIGQGYSVASGLSTTGGSGNGCLLDITAVNTWISPIPANPYYAVRIGWPTFGAPAWPITDNVIFIEIREADDQYNRQRYVKNTLNSDNVSINQATTYTRVVELNLVCYGPLAYDNACLIRDGMFYQSNHDTLALENLYLVPDIVAPRRTPEPHMSQWWDRADLQMKFNELVIRNITLESIAASEIIVEDSQETLVTINVT